MIVEVVLQYGMVLCGVGIEWTCMGRKIKGCGVSHGWGSVI